MKKSIILVIAMIFFFQLSQKASAAFYLEPFAGVILNSKYKSTVDEGTLSGSQVGARIGWTNMGLSLGLDGRRSAMKLETETIGLEDSDYTATQSGFFIGYEFPILFRVWANYVFSSEASDNDDSSNKFKGGGGYNFGIGYKPLPFISINLEMFTLNYKTYENALGETNVDFKSSGMLLGVSIPVSI